MTSPQKTDPKKPSPKPDGQGGSASPQGGGMASLAARANAEKLHYFTLIQEQTKFHREALANIERYVFEMQQKKIEAGTLEQAVKGLERTVRSLEPDRHHPSGRQQIVEGHGGELQSPPEVPLDHFN